MYTYTSRFGNESLAKVHTSDIYGYMYVLTVTNNIHVLKFSHTCRSSCLHNSAIQTPIKNT